jgi:hypothetical protein
MIEAVLVGFQRQPDQQVGGNALHGELHGVGAGREAAVAERVRAPALAPVAEQLGRGFVIE